MGMRTPAVAYGIHAAFGTKTITTAVTGVTTYAYGAVGLTGLGSARYVNFQSILTYGSGGTTADVYLQTSLDGGTTWIDVANHHYTTATATKVSAVTTGIAPAAQAFAPGDAALSAGTIIQGILGDRIRLKLTTTGTYAGATTLKCDCWIK